MQSLLSHTILALVLATGAFAVPDETSPITASSGESNSQEVIAGGVGKDEKLALRDAFRNAVEQVVGMVVDTTVQVENDEIIQDQILTASDGFIKEYKTISSEVQDGLTRVRIKAVVERKSLVQKLEANQVIVKKVDMGNLFAKVASDAQAVEGATQILSERLNEFHKIWTAKAGEPNYDRNSGVMSIPLTISADPSAYAASAKRLAEVLDKISIRKSRKLLTSIESRENNGKPTPARNLVYFASNKEEISNIPFFQEIVSNPNNDRLKKWKSYKVTEWLKAEEFDQLQKSAFWIWICMSERNNTTEWAGYAIDADINKIGALLFPKWSISMILRDANGGAIGSYELSNLTFDSNFDFVSQDPNDGSKSHSQMGIHPHLIDMGDLKNNKYGMGNRKGLREENTSFDTPYYITENIFRFQSLISPNFMSFGEDFKPNMAAFGTGNFAYWKEEVVEATFKISPDDIKDIKKTEISISAQPRAIKTK
jgi:hypothetical protein